MLSRFFSGKLVDASANQFARYSSNCAMSLSPQPSGEPVVIPSPHRSCLGCLLRIVRSSRQYPVTEKDRNMTFAGIRTHKFTSIGTLELSVEPLGATINLECHSGSCFHFEYCETQQRSPHPYQPEKHQEPSSSGPEEAKLIGGLEGKTTADRDLCHYSSCRWLSHKPRLYYSSYCIDTKYNIIVELAQQSVQVVQTTTSLRADI